MLILTSLLRLIHHLIFRDISLKSQELFAYFSSHSNGFYLPIFFVEPSLLVIFLFVYLFVIIRLFIRIFPYLAFPFRYSCFLFFQAV